jgi:hypothetical protein
MDRFAAVLGDIALEISRRERRWLAIGTDVVAFAADDDAGWTRLRVEAELLARWRAAGVPAPRVLRDIPTARIQVRERMHGITGSIVEPLLFGGEPPRGVARYAADAPLSAFGERLAHSYGELAARIRGAVTLADGRALGFAPRDIGDLDAAIAILATTSAPSHVVAAVTRARAWLVAPPVPSAIIHGDLHFSNMCLADDGAIVGVFDLDDSAADAAETDLQYVHSLGPRFVARALAAYGAHDRRAVERAHLRTAIGHLLWHGPQSERRASIVDWIGAAVEHLL